MPQDKTTFPWTIRLGQWVFRKTGWNGLFQFAYGRWLRQ